MNSSPWRLEEVDGDDEQYPVESRFAVRHTPPDEQDPYFGRSTPTQVCFLRFAVRHTPPDQQDPRFERGRSNTRPFPPFCGTLDLVSIGCSVQAGWLPRIPLPPDEHDTFRCLPMNTTHSAASP